MVNFDVWFVEKSSFGCRFYMNKMRGSKLVHLIFGVLACLSVVNLVKAEDPYKFYTWTVTYGTISPIGVSQQVYFFKF